MKDIQQLHYNSFGVSFYWTKEGKSLSKRIQMVFKDTGIYLTPEQVLEFSALIKDCEGANCADCVLKNYCCKFLLKTPVPEIDLAVNYTEYLQIKDLIEGTLFKIGLYNYLNKEGLN